MPKASNPCRRRRIHAESMPGAQVWLSLARRAPATQIKLSNSPTLQLAFPGAPAALLLHTRCTRTRSQLALIHARAGKYHKTIRELSPCISA
jgi:hypothetical protein